MMRKWIRIWGLLLMACLAPALAAEKGEKPQLEGKTVAAKPFRLDALRGKVVLVLFWSTDCAVCRDKMPELRANVQGWAGKPFELVSVSTDRKLQDALDYELIVSRLVPLTQRFSLLWAGDAGYRDTFGKPASWLKNTSAASRPKPGTRSPRCCELAGTKKILPVRM